MKLPRDLSGLELARLPKKYGYNVARQTGSHLRLTSTVHGIQHHIAIPAHKILVGTLAGILKEVAAHLEKPRSELDRELFGS